MMNQGYISGRQFMILVILFMMGNAVLLTPTIVIDSAKQDAWIAAALGLVEGVVIALLYDAIGRRFPGKTPIEFTGEILGNWMGKMVSFLFFTFAFIDTILMLNQVGDFITTYILVETPIQAILLLFSIVLIFGVRLGIEPLARAAELLFPWVVALFLILILTLAPEMKGVRLEPILAEGVKPVLEGNIRYVAFIFETVIWFMVFPAFTRAKATKKPFLIGMIVANLLLVMMNAVSVSVLGADIAKLYNYTPFKLAQRISLGQFVERVEVIVAGIWFITLFIKTAISFYASAFSLALVFRLKDYRPLTMPLGLIMIPLSLIFVPNILYLTTFTKLIWPPFTATFGVLLPVLLLGAAILRRKGTSA
ncbi:GerAB/ArcD/ProY family transporter [Salinithrix halophila]|uniref:Endospore germination permease n=1 Tax=Salinithrix halophila TaxID=1485204 RepID=A0ABV8JKS8_9BACL